MSPDQLLAELSIKMYQPPLSEVRGGATIPDLSDPLVVAMLILDLETEVSLGGIRSFLGNSSGRFAAQTAGALEVIGCSRHAELLRRVLDIAAEAGMTHEAIQQERSDLAPFTITTFSQLHGDKWDLAIDQIEDAASEIDYLEVIALTESFIGRHTERFHEALGY